MSGGGEMKKICFIVAALIVLLSGSMAGAAVPEWTWDDPYVLSSKISEMAVDYLTGDVYGIGEDGNVVALGLSTTVPGVAASAGSVPPVRDIAVGLFGTVYAIGDSLVATWDPSTGLYTAVPVQPKVPDGVSGVYKHIAAGKFGKIYVLFESEDGNTQYVLQGHLPVITDGFIVKITPAVLNLLSKGKWVNCSITLPNGYSAKDIDPSSIRITHIQVQVPGHDPIDVDVDIAVDPNAALGLSGKKVNAKFTRFDKALLNDGQAISSILAELLGGNKITVNIALTVEAQLKTTGELFQGTANIRVQIPALK